jgi:hypothetical protein
MKSDFVTSSSNFVARITPSLANNAGYPHERSVYLFFNHGSLEV